MEHDIITVIPVLSAFSVFLAKTPGVHLVIMILVAMFCCLLLFLEMDLCFRWWIYTITYDLCWSVLLWKRLFDRTLYTSIMLAVGIILNAVVLALTSGQTTLSNYRVYSVCLASFLLWAVLALYRLVKEVQCEEFARKYDMTLRDVERIIDARDFFPTEFVESRLSQLDIHKLTVEQRDDAIHHLACEIVDGSRKAADKGSVTQRMKLLESQFNSFVLSRLTSNLFLGPVFYSCVLFL